MLLARGCFCRPATLLAGLLLIALLLLPLRPLSASGPQQGGTVDIADKECSFWLDFDDDGEGDTAISAEPDSYARQETPVVGGCSFKLNTDAETTLIIVSELADWSSEVEITREPGLPQRSTLHPGKSEIPGLQGGMRISVNHTGVTPRSGKSRALPDDFTHEVQIPRPFRLLEITVTAADGTKDRLEESVQSASSAYIDTHEHLSDRIRHDGDAAPDGPVDLAGELLEEGYPQIANRVLAMDVSSADGGGTNWWMWSTIAIAALVGIAMVAIVVLVIRNRPGPATVDQSQQPRSRHRM